MHKPSLLLIAVAASQWAFPAVAETPVAGAEARAWLQLQTSNDAAVGAPEPMPGEVATRVYERWLKSFEYPIPETFERERFVEGGGGS